MGVCDGDEGDPQIIENIPDTLLMQLHPGLPSVMEGDRRRQMAAPYLCDLAVVQGKGAGRGSTFAKRPPADPAGGFTHINFGAEGTMDIYFF